MKGLTKYTIVLILSAFLLVGIAGTASANVPGVAISAPPPPPAPNVLTQGDTANIKVVVAHKDTFQPVAEHYVDSVLLFNGDQLIKEWKFSEQNANPQEIFTLTTQVPANQDMRLKAVTHCTMHGYSMNGVYVAVLPQGTTDRQSMTMNVQNAGEQVFGLPSINQAADYLPQKDVQLLQRVQQAQSQDIQQTRAEALQKIPGMMQGQQGMMQGQQGMMQGQQQPGMFQGTRQGMQGQPGMMQGQQFGQQGMQGQQSQMR